MNAKDGCTAKCTVETEYTCQYWPSECSKDTVSSVSSEVMEITNMVFFPVGVAVGSVATLFTGGAGAATLGLIMVRHYVQYASIDYVSASLTRRLEDKSEQSRIWSFRFGNDTFLKSDMESVFGSDQSRRNLSEDPVYQSSSFIVNRFELIVLIFIIMILTAIVAPLVHISPGAKNDFVLTFIYRTLRRIFFFGVYLAILMEGYFFGCLLTFYEIYVAIEYKNYNVLSLMFSGVVLLILLALPIILIVHYSLKRKTPEDINEGFLA